jgi:hypothetical protein
MVAYGFNMPAEETLVVKIKNLIDEKLELTENIKAEGGPREAVHLANLNKKLLETAKEIERMVLGL